MNSLLTTLCPDWSSGLYILLSSGQEMITVSSEGLLDDFGSPEQNRPPAAKIMSTIIQLYDRKIYTGLEQAE